VRAETGRHWRVPVQTRRGQLRGGPRESSPAGEAFEEHEAEGVDVDRLSDGLSLDLLGREVGRRAEHVAGRRQPRRVDEPGDPEVGETCHAVCPDQDVGRFDVTMHDPLTVDVRECRRDLRADSRRDLLVEGT
jgi:hypothetical protein